jgi:fido (protein-threonine AMPylation protein)
MTPSHGAPFRGFRDHDESPFFRAPGRTPEETWNLSVDRLGEIIGTLGARASAGPIQMSPALLCAWHREIFGELFPDDAGRLRRRRPDTWDPEHVYFGGNVGTRQPRDIRGYRGTTPRELPRRLGKICTEFNTVAAEIRASEIADSYDAVHAATRLYAKVLRAHPFVDGNLRATTVALNAGLLTLGLPRVRFNDLQLHDDLLGIAFIGKHDPYQPLAEHIAEIIGKPGEP